MSNPLDAITIDARHLDRQLVADVLAPYLRIDRETATILPLQPAWDNASNEIRVCLYLLARRAMVALELVTRDAVWPKEIERETGIPGGSVRPAIMRLLRQGYIDRGREPGTYRIPNHLLGRVRRALAFAGAREG